LAGAFTIVRDIVTSQSELAREALQPANGYQRRRLETRRQLVDAGRSLFRERPLEQVSIESITARAGVAKGSFYNHFASRDALFDEVVEGALAALLQRFEAYEPATEEPLPAGLARARFAFFTLLSDRATCELLLQGGQPTRGGPIDRVLHSMLGDRLAWAVSLGSLSHLDTELVYAAYFGVVTGAIAHLLLRGDNLDPGPAADSLTQLCFAVLGLPHPPPPYGAAPASTDQHARGEP
jgi:AcrR family transcriptional regulator